VMRLHLWTTAHTMPCQWCTSLNPGRFCPLLTSPAAPCFPCSSPTQRLSPAGGAPPMPIASVVSLLRSYSTLAYAPPMALLKLLQGLAEPQLGELQPEELTGLLQCYSLFKACGPELWNRVVGILTGSAVESLSQAALLQLYQVGVGRDRGRREGSSSGRICTCMGVWRGGVGGGRFGRCLQLCRRCGAHASCLSLQPPAVCSSLPYDSPPPPCVCHQVYLLVCRADSTARYQIPPALIMAAWQVGEAEGQTAGTRCAVRLSWDGMLYTHTQRTPPPPPRMLAW
jgi:hypothetical protein